MQLVHSYGKALTTLHTNFFKKVEYPFYKSGGQAHFGLDLGSCRGKVRNPKENYKYVKMLDVVSGGFWTHVGRMLDN